MDTDRVEDVSWYDLCCALHVTDTKQGYGVFNLKVKVWSHVAL